MSEVQAEGEVRSAAVQVMFWDEGLGEGGSWRSARMRCVAVFVARRRWARIWPTKPEAPVMRIFIFFFRYYVYRFFFRPEDIYVGRILKGYVR